MSVQLETVGAFAGMLLWLLIVLVATLSAFLYSRLRHVHTEVWQKLGEPTLLVNSTFRNLGRVTRFLWLSEYRRLDDRRLTRIAYALKLVQAVAFVDGVVIWVLILNGNWP